MEIIVFLFICLIVVYLYTLLGEVGSNDLKTEQSVGFTSGSQTSAERKSLIPEDSILKRHFLANLKTEVETELFPRPTCSTLARHYDSLVMAGMEKRSYK